MNREKPKMIEYEGSNYYHCSKCGLVVHKDNIEDHKCNDKRERVSMYATVIKIDDNVLDQIADRIVEKLIERLKIQKFKVE